MISPVLTYYDMVPEVTAFSSTRHGGVSRGSYAELNVNRWCGDNPEAVASNRAALCQQLGISESRLVIPHQVHGTVTRIIADDFFPLSANSKDTLLEGADAVMTNIPGVCVGVSTADCIPILLYDGEHRACCAVHAGWRGTVARIAEKAIREMAAAFGTRPQALKAVIGPGISLENFEVGDEVYSEFERAGFDMEPISRRYDKWHIDLWACNQRQLERTGVAHGNIRIAGVCTFAHADKYFSARRLGTESGRILSGIMIKDNPYK